MTTQHTPGPWVVMYDGKTINDPVTVADGEFPAHKIATVQQVPNAHLIAAAPELLEACATMADVLRTLLNTGTGKALLSIQSAERLYGKLDSAIARAEGR